MRLRALLPALILVPVLLAAPAPAAAQEVVVRSSPAWLGFSYDPRWIMQDSGCSPQVVVENVVQGSPAERAGLRIGDAIIAVDGEPVPPGRLQTLAARLIPGDSVRLRLLRDGRVHDVTAVAGRRPDRPLTVYVETGGRLRSVGTPVIERAGDTLIARNAAEWDPGRVRSYWVRDADGRTEYHVIGSWSPGPLDQEVAELLACADSARYAPSVSGEPVRVTLQQFQARADSLRVVYNLRALERTERILGDSLRVRAPDSVAGALRLAPGEPGAWRVSPDDPGTLFLRTDSAGTRLYRTPDSGTVRIVRPGGSYSFTFDDHVTLGLRGVAGAELTALEPELAEYFRNADRGLLILRIAPGTPADRAGLRPGDVVISADGRRVESVAELRQIIALPTAGAIELRVVRQGRIRDLELRRE